eukprot:8904970-Alexandrium_andersonii.AAC.1
MLGEAGRRRADRHGRRALRPRCNRTARSSSAEKVLTALRAELRFAADGIRKLGPFRTRAG